MPVSPEKQANLGMKCKKDTGKIRTLVTIETGREEAKMQGRREREAYSLTRKK